MGTVIQKFLSVGHLANTRKLGEKEKVKRKSVVFSEILYRCVVSDGLLLIIVTCIILFLVFST